MQCRICGRKADKNGFCEFHAMAYTNLLEKYEAWREALGLSWREYLSEVVRNPYTGSWVREVAEHLLKRGGERPVGQEG